MKKKKGIKPTAAELEILQVLWTHGPCTVRFVNQLLNRERRVGYTTTLKLMQNMWEKSMVTRDESSRSHLYSAVLDEKETQGILLDRLLQSAFGGSALKLVAQALGNHRASREEIEKIRNLLDEMQGGKK